MKTLNVTHSTDTQIKIDIWDNQDRFCGTLENSRSDYWGLKIWGGLEDKLIIPMSMAKALLWASLKNNQFSFILS